MAKGSERDLPEGPILSDLLSCGYVECIGEKKEEIAPVQAQESLEEATVTSEETAAQPGGDSVSEETAKKRVKKTKKV